MKNQFLYIFLLVLAGCSTPAAKKEKADTGFTNSFACTLSETAYCIQPQDTLSKYLPGWKIAWNPEAVNGNYAFAATDGKKYVIAIRGSVLQFNNDAFNNWVKQDLHVVVQEKWPYTDSTSDAKISQGAYDAWQNMITLKDKITGKTLKQFLDSTTDSNTPLLITGHSLGGNLASVYASWLDAETKKENKRLKHLSIITFAAPAAGNEAFAADFDKKFPEAVRIENTNDIVTKFPVAASVGKLSDLYKPSPASDEIEIDFSFFSVKLSTVFDGIRLTMKAAELANGNSVYAHTKGTPLRIPLSGKNKNNTVEDFFAEAGYQHGVNQYAAAIGAPLIKTD